MGCRHTHHWVYGFLFEKGYSVDQGKCQVVKFQLVVETH
jgi:hypothetical protein